MKVRSKHVSAACGHTRLRLQITVSQAFEVEILSIIRAFTRTSRSPSPLTLHGFLGKGKAIKKIIKFALK